jgi:hypothetical protein
MDFARRQALRGPVPEPAAELGLTRPFSEPSLATVPTVDEADAISLVILTPVTPHSGRGAGKPAATDAAPEG